jgi:hypothetical protein
MTLDLTAADLVLGHLRQGINYFHAFLDLDGSRNPAIDGSINWLTWTPGEPAAVADGHDKGIDIGWDRNEVRFGLTDEAKSFARLSWENLPGSANPQNTIALYAAVGGAQVFERVIQAPRTWLHEGDIIAGKTSNFGLPSDGPGTKVYRWKLNGQDRGLVTNEYRSPWPGSIVIEPKNDVLAASPEFQFRLPGEATEFEIEIVRGTSTGNLLYSGRHLAPPRRRYSPDAVDLCVWRFPYHAGDVMPNGEVFANDTYYWKVRAFSPAETAGGFWSAQLSFGLKVKAVVGDSGGKGWLTVNVRYPGGAGLGGGAPIRVQAFKTRSFNGIADAEKQIAAPGAVTLAGLDPGLYYIRAYVDQNNTRSRNFWESYGYLRNPADSVEPYRVVGVQASELGQTPPVTVTIRDADTDNDLIPDALEYVMNGAGGGDWLAKAGPGPIISSDPYTDFDGDGLNDLSELNAGTLWNETDSDGDGINDRLDRDLFGIEASIQKVEQVLQLTGLDPAVGLLGWRWTTRDALLGGPVPLGQPAQTEVVPLGVSASYVIEFTESLTAPVWQLVTNLSSGVSGGQFTLPRTTSPSGFYRIKMLTE